MLWNGLEDLLVKTGEQLHEFRVVLRLDADTMPRIRGLHILGEDADEKCLGSYFGAKSVEDRFAEAR